MATIELPSWLVAMLLDWVLPTLHLVSLVALGFFLAIWLYKKLGLMLE